MTVIYADMVERDEAIALQAWFAERGIEDVTKITVEDGVVVTAASLLRNSEGWFYINPDVPTEAATVEHVIADGAGCPVPERFL